LNYADVTAAAVWLCRAFGFTQRLRIGEHRMQLNAGSGAIVIAKSDSNGSHPVPAAHSIMVRVSNVDQHFDRATKQGATVSGKPASMPYGERQYSAIDVDPQLWGGAWVEADGTRI
jgi:uncharacterized glyoxalase superfamily protein PhnB